MRRLPRARQVSSRRSAESANSRVILSSSTKTVQFFIRTHNETLSVAAMSVNNPDRPPVGINR
jgi:hypothetical protein